VPQGALARLNTCLGSHDEKLSLGKKENHPRIDKKAKFAREDGAREATLSCRAARTPE